jgi:hypothetical protein
MLLDGEECAGQTIPLANDGIIHVVNLALSRT